MSIKSDLQEYKKLIENNDPLETQVLIKEEWNDKFGFLKYLEESSERDYIMVDKESHKHQQLEKVEQMLNSYGFFQNPKYKILHDRQGIPLENRHFYNDEFPNFSVSMVYSKHDHYGISIYHNSLFEDIIWAYGQNNDKFMNKVLDILYNIQDNPAELGLAV